MNKLYLITLSALLTLGATTTLVVVESYSNRKIVETARQDLMAKYAHEYELLTKSVRNELLQDNFRYARNTLRRMVGSEQTAFSIEPIAGTRDMSDNFASVISSPDRFSFAVPIYFSEEAGAKWGQITYALPLTEITALSRNLESQLIQRSVVIALVFFAGFLLAFKLLWSTTAGMNRELESILNLRATADKSVTKSIWGPVLNRMALLVREHSKLQETAALSEVAKQVAHDIRSPVSALAIVSKVSKNLNEDERKMITAATERIKSIADDLLGRYRDVPAVAMVPAIAAQMQAAADSAHLRDKLKDLLALKSVELKGEVREWTFDDQSGGSAAMLKGDPDQILRIVDNLLNNAIEASVANDAVGLKIRTQQDAFLIDVIDSGKGIEPAVAERLFAQDFKSAKAGGNGLALKYARATLSRYGGDLTFQSRPRHTVFTVHLKAIGG